MIDMRMIREIIMMTRHRWRVDSPPIRSLGQKQRSHDLRQVIIINISITIFNIPLIIFIIIIILILMTITRGSGILQSDRGSGHIHSR